ncbi:MAG: GNAT family N-acetyltransferase [Yoonia sp.]
MHESNGTKGRYYIVHTTGESELLYAVIPPDRMIAEHTQVASGQEGDDIGPMMLREMIADARSKGLLIVPHCPFVNAQRRRHPEFASAFSV